VAIHRWGTQPESRTGSHPHSGQHLASRIETVLAWRTSIKL